MADSGRSDSNGGTAKGRKPKGKATFKTNNVQCSTRTIHVPAPGATVWATWFNFLGAFKENPSSGWSHLVSHLHSIDELVKQLETLRLRNSVRHLALVGHNESNWVGVRPDGSVTFSAPIHGGDPRPKMGLRESYVPPQPTPPEAFAELAPYLLPDAWVSLYTCISAAGAEGDRLLKALSVVLPGRTIVGFTSYVVVGSSGGFADPGNASGTTFGEDGKSDPVLSPLTPWGKAAKRAENGMIVHIPFMEKHGIIRRVTRADGTHENVEGPPYRCAAGECCPGHSSKEHDCDGY
jgi:hypothetical protein